MDQQQVNQAVAGLNRAYPDGWRCGEPTTDAMTVILYSGLQQMVSALLSQGRNDGHS